VLFVEGGLACARGVSLAPRRARGSGDPRVGLWRPARGALATPVRKIPYSAPAQQLGSATEAVGYAHVTVVGRALYCTVGLKAPAGVG
jgi:hypothetical protein